MILRVRITKTGGQILRNWALHRVSDTVLLKNVASELVTGSGGGSLFYTPGVDLSSIYL